MTRRSSGVAHVGDDLEVASYRAAAFTGIGAADVNAAVMDLGRIAPGVLTTTLESDAPTVFVLVPSSWPARRAPFALAKSWDAIVVWRNERISTHHVHIARDELADAATIARRVCASGSVVGIKDLLVYRCLIAAPVAELEVLVEKTIGGLLNQPRAERQRLMETLWARHQHDTDSGAVRALRKDPRTLRRRRDRVLALTGLDPARQPDRFRLDLGLHALRVLETAQSFPRRDDPVNWPYPRESHEPDIRPNFVIAEPTHRSSSSAPHPPRTTADRAGGEEHTQ
jgi:hypothetical protein